MTHYRFDELLAGEGEAGPVDPFPAATVIVLRPGAARLGEGTTSLEVLMIRRHRRASFAPNAWVFPGGAVDDLDRKIALAQGRDDEVSIRRVAAARELFEEGGLWLGAPLAGAEQKRLRLLAGNESFRELLAAAPIDFSDLVWTSHWITPVGFPKRFDTYFFLARSPEGAVATAANSEAVEVAWIAPAEALARNAAGEFDMVFPTVRNLEALLGFTSVPELLASRQAAQIVAMQPVIVDVDGRKKIVLP